MSENIENLTLSKTAMYRIKVPGALDEGWLDWNGGLTITVKDESESISVTILTIRVDQAALHGLLRHLYSLGLPLLSVECIAFDEAEVEDSS